MPPLTKTIDLYPGISVYNEGDDDTARDVVIKRETRESAERALRGYVALYMAGEENMAAPFSPHGKRPVSLESDWTPVPIGNGVSIVPADGKGKMPVAVNTRKVCFRHRTLSMTHIPKFVRPVMKYSRDLYTKTPYGVCGSKLLPGSPVARKALATVARSVVALAEHLVFPTDLKLGNFVYFWTVPSPESKKPTVVDDVRFIDLDQFGSTHSGWRSCSFFVVVASLEENNPALFDAAMGHPDICNAFYQAQNSLKGEPPHCTAVLEMHLLMRAIIALLNFQMRAEVAVPPELLVAPEDEVYLKCYVGGSAFFERSIVV